MNAFGFVMTDAVQGLIFALVWGLFLGFLIGLVRFLIFYYAEREKS